MTRNFEAEWLYSCDNNKEVYRSHSSIELENKEMQKSDNRRVQEEANRGIGSDKQIFVFIKILFQMMINHNSLCGEVNAQMYNIHFENKQKRLDKKDSKQADYINLDANC